MRYGQFYNIGYFEAKVKARGLPILGAQSGVCDEASEHDYNIVLAQLPSDLSSNPGSLPFIFRESNLDALIISHAGNLTSELKKVIDASGLPVVYLNEKKSYNAVYVDDLQGGEEITRHLISVGNREIAYVSCRPEPSHYSAADRAIMTWPSSASPPGA